jgi:hypothetical protein
MISSFFCLSQSVLVLWLGQYASSMSARILLFLVYFPSILNWSSPPGVSETNCMDGARDRSRLSFSCFAQSDVSLSPMQFSIYSDPAVYP